MASSSANRVARRKPRALELSRSTLVEATLDLIAIGGVSSVTMKGLALRIGCSPMAAYKHVRNKDDLLELAADELIGRITDDLHRGSWRDQVRRLTESVLSMNDATPWVSAVMLKSYDGRSSDTPNISRARANRLGIFRRAGFTPKNAALAESLFDNMIVGLTTAGRYRARGLWTAAPEPGGSQDACTLAESDYRRCALDALILALDDLLARQRTN